MRAKSDVSLREADDPKAKSYTHKEVTQAMQERVDRARDNKVSGTRADRPASL